MNRYTRRRPSTGLALAVVAVYFLVSVALWAVGVGVLVGVVVLALNLFGVL